MPVICLLPSEDPPLLSEDPPSEDPPSEDPLSDDPLPSDELPSEDPPSTSYKSKHLILRSPLFSSPSLLLGFMG